jgi:uncharacterized protein YaaN involved in tellurite resistance
MTEPAFQTKNEVALQEKALPPEFIKKIGLQVESIEEVTQMSSELDVDKAFAVTTWGKEAAEHTVAYADRMLEMVNTRDLDNAGDQLRNVLVTAKKINTSGLSINRSRVPVLGALIDKLKVKYSSAMAQFSTAREAIDATVAEIEQTKTNLEQRITDLDEAFKQVQVEYTMLGKYIAAGRLASARINEQITELSAQDQTPMSVQKISDMRAYNDKLEKRVADLMVLQQNALNTLPAIRLVQSNNSVLIDKYNTITTLTIPVWKRQMMLGLSLEEQANSVELAEKVDDYTNELLRKQADMLKANTLATAKANQRLVIDVDTISHVQNTLIDTVTEVTAIQNKASVQREEAVNKIMSLRTQLNEKLLGNDNAPTSRAH